MSRVQTWFVIASQLEKKIQQGDRHRAQNTINQAHHRETQTPAHCSSALLCRPSGLLVCQNTHKMRLQATPYQF